MQIDIYQVDAFTGKVFGGNPAAVCPLEKFLDDETLQNIAVENNLSETAYIVPMDGKEYDYHLRWFTPGCEVALCGHATLASARVIFDYLRPELDVIRFKSLSGLLTAKRTGDLIWLDFPAIPAKEMDQPDGLAMAMNAVPELVLEPLSVHEGDRDLLIVYSDQSAIEALDPDLIALKNHAPYGFVATAPAREPSLDFVSRCFFPNHGIGEDPVTGSAHSLSAPYWAKKFGKSDLRARQISARGGDLALRVEGDRVHMGGQAVEYMRGRISL